MVSFEDLDFEKKFTANLHKVSEATFEEHALALFNFQYANNFLYQEYIDKIKVNPAKVNSLYKIPFLPIDFFKNHVIKTGNWQEEISFQSSGTTGAVRSSHYVKNLTFYVNHAQKLFEDNYGSLQDCVVLALLPSYLERDNSSLVFMVNHFIKTTNNANSGFFLHNLEGLMEKLIFLIKNNIKTILIGVTFALLDLAEKFTHDLSKVIVIETGGMKGKREEITREEVHEILKNQLSIENVHSEYGMTEMLSQAYSHGQGIFAESSSMKVLIRDTYDPFDLQVKRKSGGVNIIDLANVNSCAFIETKDIGTAMESNNFRILGRFDNSEIRGCNLLIQ